MNDLISRQAAIDALGEEPPVWYDGEGEIAERNQWRRDVTAIKALPSAQPEQRWIPFKTRPLTKAGIHKAILECTDFSDDEKRESVLWLLLHGYQQDYIGNPLYVRFGYLMPSPPKKEEL